MNLMATIKPKALSDKEMAVSMLSVGAASAQALCTAAISAHNPDLKRLYKDYLQDAMMGVEALETYCTDRGWIQPFDAPEEQLRMALREADELVEPETK